MDRDGAELMIEEAVGPALSLSSAVAAISMGVFALLMAGVLPVLLGGLIDLQRLNAPQMNLAAMGEGLTMGLGTGLASALLPPRRLRLIALVSTLVLVTVNLAGLWTDGVGVVIARAVAGVPEGLMLWIAIGMIARHVTPERMSAILLAGMTAGQFVLALALTVVVLPRFGADGGFVALSVATLPGLVAALWLPRDYAPLVKPVGESASPPLRGWAAVVAITVFTASFPAVATNLQPIAHQAGLGAGVARIALTISLLMQLVGGVVATVLAGRVHYLPVLVLGTLVYLVCWTVMGASVPAWAFVAAYAVVGFSYLMITPFLTPMAIEADPSRRAAMLIGGAQVLAGALGPLAASRLVSNTNLHPALWLGAGLLTGGLVMIVALHFVARHDRAHRQIAVVEAVD